MKNPLVSMFSEDGGLSHKRILGTIGFLCLIVFLFVCDKEVKQEALSAVEYTTITYGLGTVVEKFKNKSNTAEI
jgi:hypothetical protein